MHADKLIRLATYASVAVAFSLVIAKLVVWQISGSISLMASLVDSLMDVAASLINLFAVRYALKPADDDHRFGHGKMESLAGLAQASFIAGSGVFLLSEGLHRIFFPEAIKNESLALMVMGISLAVTCSLVLFQSYVVAKSKSIAVKADRAHYMTDILTNLGIIAALGLCTIGLSWADPVFALVIAGYILYSAYEIGRESVDHLMDKELESDKIDLIVAEVKKTPEVIGLHDLKTRQSGRDIFIQMHLDLDANMNLHQAHEIAEVVEVNVSRLFPNSEVIIHQDPYRENNSGVKFRVF
jgi:ferrous-iron efflux pump FieF